MNHFTFWTHLGGIWLGYLLASVWWGIAFRMFIVPAYWRWEKEGRGMDWPIFARWTSDLTVDWHRNHHVWALGALGISAMLVWAFRTQKTNVAKLARAVCYGYLSILIVLSILIGVVSTL